MTDILFDGVHLCAIMESPEDLDALHHFANGLGLRRSWFQHHPRHPHYNVLSPQRKRMALTLGAREVTTRALAQLSREGKLTLDTTPQI